MVELEARLGEITFVVSPAQGGAQLFLSYRVPETGRKGDRTVLKLKSALESHGYSVFVDESGGASWVQTIQVAITDCQVFIPVCSKTYGDTKWTLRELHAADEANKEILPIWHSGDYPPKPVSMYLGNLQRLPRGSQPLKQANFQSLVSDLVAAIKKGLALDQRRTRI
ncbi:TIR domain-containing protein, partial [Haematococcus lacustris]